MSVVFRTICRCSTFVLPRLDRPSRTRRTGLLPRSKRRTLSVALDAYRCAPQAQVPSGTLYRNSDRCTGSCDQLLVGERRQDSNSAIRRSSASTIASGFALSDFQRLTGRCFFRHVAHGLRNQFFVSNPAIANKADHGIEPRQRLSLDVAFVEPERETRPRSGADACGWHGDRRHADRAS